MPYTISHVAAVLPFGRWLERRRLISAAVIGSMVPDFGMLLALPLSRADTHSAHALLTFCLPVGLAAYWLFEWVLKTAVLETLPDAPYQRSRPFAAPAEPFSARRWMLAAGAIMAGAVTHLVWDAFTHEGARGVRIIPQLDDLHVDIAGHQLVGAHLTQDLSSVLGLLVVFWVLVRALRGSAAPQSTPARRLDGRERRAWHGAYALAALAASAAVFALMRIGGEYGGPGAGALVNQIAISLLRGAAASLLLVSAALRLRLRA
jgi:hypothetical protein